MFNTEIIKLPDIMWLGHNEVENSEHSPIGFSFIHNVI